MKDKRKLVLISDLLQIIKENPNILKLLPIETIMDLSEVILNVTKKDFNIALAITSESLQEIRTSVPKMKF